MAKNTKHTTKQTKSIGPKFCATLLIFVLALFALVSNLILLKTVREEMRISFDYEAETAVETLASSIDTLYNSSNSDADKTLALEMVENATWNNGQRRFWAANPDYTEILAGEKEYDNFYDVSERETAYGFIVLAGYDEAYFNANAYPETEGYIRISTAVTLVIAVFALGTCLIVFHRSGR